MPASGNYRIAFLIDAENQSSKDFNHALASLKPLGQVALIRAYACWEKSNPKSWMPFFESGLVEKRNLRKSIGKNAADKTLIWEAGQLIIDGVVDAIALYSGDGDFEMAIETWKGQGIKIICFHKPNTSKAILGNADHVVYEESGRIESTIDSIQHSNLQIITRVRNVLLPGPKVVGKIPLSPPLYQTTAETKRTLNGFKVYIHKAVKECGGKMVVSELGYLIRSQFPNFSPTQYQCKKLTAFLRLYFPEAYISLDSDRSTYWIELKSK